ncbi:MAG TPA: UDP-N-acetylenolpyruvoylglucosamine reductase [Clostridiales bacterium]|nr:UDP-N-acetylenolpyruvoylglucosamine reductase [Clostridiales bacterium]
MTDIRENVPLKQYTTFKCGGPAAMFAEPSSEEEIRELLSLASSEGRKVLILGAGSNMLVSDKGFDGLVIRIGRNMSDIKVGEEDPDGYVEIEAQAGASLALLGTVCARESLEGAEFCCGIPGNVGGAVFMNAGAYGREIKDIAVSVTYIKDNEIRTLPASECGFGYRTSVFEKTEGTVVVTSLKIRLKRGNKETIDSYVAELREKRTRSQPLEVPSAGSTFKRPEGYYAGALIEGSGLKGFKLDESGAQVSPKHAGFVVNNGGAASGSDVMRLIRYVQDKVYADSGVRLQTEVRLIGEWE